MLCNTRRKGEEEIKDCFQHTDPVLEKMYCSCCEKLMDDACKSAGYPFEPKEVWSFVSKSRVKCYLSICVTCSATFGRFGSD